MLGLDSSIHIRKNQARRGEQDWGLAARDARGGVLVGCAEREENRFRGVRGQGSDEVDRSLAMKGHTASAEPMASARQEGPLRGCF